jgi:hypothetical protein
MDNAGMVLAFILALVLGYLSGLGLRKLLAARFSGSSQSRGWIYIATAVLVGSLGLLVPIAVPVAAIILFAGIGNVIPKEKLPEPPPDFEEGKPYRLLALLIAAAATLSPFSKGRPM